MTTFIIEAQEQKNGLFRFLILGDDIRYIPGFYRSLTDTTNINPIYHDAIANATIIPYTIDIAEEQRIKCDAINEFTNGIISDGFPHIDPVDGIEYQFGLTEEDQSNWLGLSVMKLQGADLTGERFRAIHKTYTFRSNSDFDVIFFKGIGRINFAVMTGAYLKDQVNDMTDSAEIAAVEDTIEIRQSIWEGISSQMR